MYCKNCGAEIPDGSRFCTNCGCSLSEGGAAGQNTSGSAAGTTGSERPSTYLALSIIVTLLCCLPFGIVGIVYASKTDSFYSAGHVDEARQYSRKAKNWCIAGLVIGLVWWIVYAVLLMAGVAWAAFWENSAYYAACLF